MKTVITKYLHPHMCDMLVKAMQQILALIFIKFPSEHLQEQIQWSHNVFFSAVTEHMFMYANSKFRCQTLDIR